MEGTLSQLLEDNRKNQRWEGLSLPPLSSPYPTQQVEATLTGGTRQSHLHVSPLLPSQKLSQLSHHSHYIKDETEPQTSRT